MDEEVQHALDLGCEGQNIFAFNSPEKISSSLQKYLFVIKAQSNITYYPSK